MLIFLSGYDGGTQIVSLISYYYGEWVLSPCMNILQIVWIEFQNNLDFYFIIVCCKSFYIVIL